jgi:hypothetical protein
MTTLQGPEPDSTETDLENSSHLGHSREAAGNVGRKVHEESLQMWQGEQRQGRQIHKEGR